MERMHEDKHACIEPPRAPILYRVDGPLQWTEYMDAFFNLSPPPHPHRLKRKKEGEMENKHYAK